APVRVGVDARRRVWLRPDADIPRETTLALARLGVSVQGGEADVELAPAADWLRLIPVQPAAFPNGSHTPILFEVTPARLSALWDEIHRLTPSATLELRIQEWTDDGDTVLVGATGVPAYTLLQPADPTMTAFQQQAPGVWVEVGYRHPLAELVQTTPGQITLIRAPDCWVSRDVSAPSSEIRSFQLPPFSNKFQDGPNSGAVELGLRMVPAEDDSDVELW